MKQPIHEDSLLLGIVEQSYLVGLFGPENLAEKNQRTRSGTEVEVPGESNEVNHSDKV